MVAVGLAREPGRRDGLRRRSRAGGWRGAGSDWTELLRQGRGHPDDEPGYEVQYPDADAGRRPGAGARGGDAGPAGPDARRPLGRRSGRRRRSAGRRLCLRALAPVHPDGHGRDRDDGGRPGSAAAGAGDRRRTRRAGPRLQRPAGPAARGVRPAPSRRYDRQQRFAGDASHQLRTPLAALLGQVQVALRRDRSPEEYRRILERVQAEGIRLRQIVESLLAPGPARGRTPRARGGRARRTGCPTTCVDGRVTPRAADLRASVATTGRWSCGSTRRCSPSSWTTCWRTRASTASRGLRSSSGPGGRTARSLLGVEDRGLRPDARGVAATSSSRSSGASRRAARVIRASASAWPWRVGSPPPSAGTLEVRSEPGAGSLFILRLPEVAGSGARAEAAGGEDGVISCGRVARLWPTRESKAVKSSISDHEFRIPNRFNAPRFADR